MFLPKMFRFLFAVLLSVSFWTAPSPSVAQPAGLRDAFDRIRELPIPTVERRDGGTRIVIPGIGELRVEGARLPTLPTLPRIGEAWPSLPVPTPGGQAPTSPVTQPALPEMPLPAPAPAPAPAPGPSALPNPMPTAAGRTLGLFVGITDYDQASDLPYCAEDAIRMQQAFVQSGRMQATDSIVLTDRQATRHAVMQALQELGQRTGPEDTFVFFFSGHGSQVHDANGDEADGQDETLVLSDGSMTDDEFTQAMQAGQGRDFVALDSCFSGGFQSDVARLSNSVGFYASSESEVSYVASEYQAGGYLSHFLQQEVAQGHADGMPVWTLQQNLSRSFDNSGATQRQTLTMGVSQGVNMRTVLFEGGQPGQPSSVLVAKR